MSYTIIRIYLQVPRASPKRQPPTEKLRPYEFGSGTGSLGVYQAAIQKVIATAKFRMSPFSLLIALGCSGEDLLEPGKL
jgi:hypothetical protein